MNIEIFKQLENIKPLVYQERILKIKCKKTSKYSYFFKNKIQKSDNDKKEIKFKDYD